MKKIPSYNRSNYIVDKNISKIHEEEVLDSIIEIEKQLILQIDEISLKKDIGIVSLKLPINKPIFFEYKEEIEQITKYFIPNHNKSILIKTTIQYDEIKKEIISLKTLDMNTIKQTKITDSTAVFILESLEPNRYEPQNESLILAYIFSALKKSKL